MAVNRIFLGIDLHSKLAISLESALPRGWFMTISNGAGGEEYCRFGCSTEDLESISVGNAVEIGGDSGTCSILPAGDEIVVRFKRIQDAEPSACSLTTNSFMRVIRLAKNRATLQ